VYVQPYLLVSTGIAATDKTDLLRLSITGKRFKNAMESYQQ
jgi:hypothetical protein